MFDSAWSPSISGKAWKSSSGDPWRWTLPKPTRTHVCILCEIYIFRDCILAHIYIYIYIHTYVHIYIFIFICWKDACVQNWDWFDGSNKNHSLYAYQHPLYSTLELMTCCSTKSPVGFRWSDFQPPGSEQKQRFMIMFPASTLLTGFLYRSNLVNLGEIAG